MTRIATSLLAFLAVVASLASCGKDEPKQQIPHVMTQMTIHLKANPSLKSLRADEVTEETISVEECMRRMTDMLLILKDRDYQSVYHISEEAKDYTTNSIKLPALAIILEDGRINDELGTARDFVLVQDGHGKGKVDTVGYIPNRVVHEAFAEAKRLHAEERYEDMVKLFTGVFVAHPCTAKQYEALKAQGLN